MKTPEEIKKGLERCCTTVGTPCRECPYYETCCVDGEDNQPAADALAYIQRLERKLEEEHEMCEFYRAKDKRQGSIISQVSKALCGKENTTYDEFSQAVSQVKSRLAQVERERDAAVHDLEDLTTRVSSWHYDCDYCKYKDKPICKNCEWQWRGVCPENTKEE